MSKRAGLHVGQSEDPVTSVEANGSAKSSLDDGGQAKDKAATAGGGGGGGRGGAVQGGIFMALLALQYGLQPILARKCVRPDLVVITQVIATEFSKIIFSTTIILLQGTAPQILRTWTLRSALLASALPASIYALQNTLVQIAYRHLDYLTFSMLNQTKLLFTAFFNFFILRSRQSPRQMAALLVMLVAAVLLTTGQDSGKSKGGEAGAKQGAEDFFLGVVSVMAASVLSGLASSICQWVVQVGGHSSYVMTIEMSVISIPVLLFSLFQTSDGEKVKTLGFFHGWTPAAMVPVVTQALGGILVGLVTKYAGGVKKGFVVISALLITAIAQYIVDGKPPSVMALVALPLVIGSTYVHTKYPYKPPAKPEKKSQ